MPREVPLIHPGTILLAHADFTIGREFWTETTSRVGLGLVVMGAFAKNIAHYQS